RLRLYHTGRPVHAPPSFDKIRAASRTWSELRSPMSVAMMSCVSAKGRRARSTKVWGAKEFERGALNAGDVSRFFARSAKRVRFLSFETSRSAANQLPTERTYFSRNFTHF